MPNAEYWVIPIQSAHIQSPAIENNWADVVCSIRKKRCRYILFWRPFRNLAQIQTELHAQSALHDLYLVSSHFVISSLQDIELLEILFALFSICFFVSVIADRRKNGRCLASR